MMLGEDELEGDELQKMERELVEEMQENGSDGENNFKVVEDAKVRGKVDEKTKQNIEMELIEGKKDEAMYSKCHKREQVEMWGEAVKWGPDNIKKSWQECCESCYEFNKSAYGKTCNVWVFCGTF